MGVSAIRPSDDNGPELLFQNAEQALNEAKEGGGNRVQAVT